MSLQEYTTEELKAELKRRSDIEKAEKRKNRDYKAKYLFYHLPSFLSAAAP